MNTGHAVRSTGQSRREHHVPLYTNGIKYTPSGSVTLTTELQDGNMLEIKVIDAGLGMSAETREKLFQKFHRVRTDRAAAMPGTGLGLWITKQIVENMKGKICCDSIEKIGTRMIVLFPAMEGRAGRRMIRRRQGWPPLLKRRPRPRPRPKRRRPDARAGPFLLLLLI